MSTTLAPIVINASSPQSPPAAVVAEREKVWKVSSRALLRDFCSRALSPKHLWRAFRLHRNRKALRHGSVDAQLALYNQLLPTDFLHYGYFDDPTLQADDISLAQVARAQTRYAERLLELAGDKDLPALDVGCGMGGLTRMLRDAGYTPVALTPNKMQAEHVRATYPETSVIRSKLEELDPVEHAQRYGTIFTSESLQYLNLDQALPILAKILAPGGRWIASDYFRTRLCGEQAGHMWDDFVAKLDQHGWRITSECDITPNILPTLRYANMWASRFAVPLMHFAFLRLRRKQPGLHYLLENVLDTLDCAATTNLSLVDDQQFAAHKRYMLLTLERSS